MTLKSTLAAPLSLETRGGFTFFGRLRLTEPGNIDAPPYREAGISRTRFYRRKKPFVLQRADELHPQLDGNAPQDGPSNSTP